MPSIHPDAYLRRFEEEWKKYRYTDNVGLSSAVPLPQGYEETIARWNSRGLPIDSLIDAIFTAMNSAAPIGDKFRYLCGVAWNKIKQSATVTKMEDDPKRYTQSDMSRVWWEAYTKGLKDGMEPDPDYADFMKFQEESTRNYDEVGEILDQIDRDHEALWKEEAREQLREEIRESLREISQEDEEAIFKGTEEGHK